MIVAGLRSGLRPGLRAGVDVVAPLSLVQGAGVGDEALAGSAREQPATADNLSGDRTES